MWIMIAGPYRTGASSESERHRNLGTLNRAAFEVFRKGHVPIIGVNLALPIIEAAGDETYESVMMPLSLALADRCDAVLRLGGLCRGARPVCHWDVRNRPDAQRAGPEVGIQSR